MLEFFIIFNTYKKILTKYFSCIVLKSTMPKLQIPKDYKPILNVKETNRAIVQIKDFFQLSLSTELNLYRVTAPLFLPQGKGLNDDLTGVETPVHFTVPDMGNNTLEIIHSLAKWKRVKLAEMKLEPGFGIYTDMNAIRAHEELDNIHSLYVDQWDWEAVINLSDRNLNFLKLIVKKIYYCLKRTEFFLYDRYPRLKPRLPEKITFIHSQDLYDRYPDLSPKMRENKICEEYGAVFIIGIGGKLSNGSFHDGRAPDYDDWTTESEPNRFGLNGDLLVWNPLLEQALELSSMGIRVTPDVMLKQLKIRNSEEKQKLYFHSRLLNNELPQTIGGGIGQSRLCMYFLYKAHIGEVQVSSWQEEIIKKCAENNIAIL